MMVAQEDSQARFAEHLPFGVACLDNAVGIEQQQIAGGQFILLFGELHIFQHTQNQAVGVKRVAFAA